MQHNHKCWHLYLPQSKYPLIFVFFIFICVYYFDLESWIYITSAFPEYQLDLFCWLVHIIVTCDVVYTFLCFLPRQVTANALSATRMCDRVRWFAYVTNAIMVLIRVDVWLVAGPVFQMPTIARSVHSQKEMLVSLIIIIVLTSLCLPTYVGWRSKHSSESRTRSV